MLTRAEPARSDERGAAGSGVCPPREALEIGFLGKGGGTRTCAAIHGGGGRTAAIGDGLNQPGA